MVGEIWGCGSFSNDPKLMPKLFDKALRRLDSEFNEIEFAVFGSKINFERFHKVMTHYYIIYECTGTSARRL